MRSLQQIAAQEGLSVQDLLYRLMGGAMQAGSAAGAEWYVEEGCRCHGQVNHDDSIAAIGDDGSRRGAVAMADAELTRSAQVAVQRHVANADPETVVAVIQALFDALGTIDSTFEDAETVADAPSGEADFDAEVQGFVERVAKLGETEAAA
jgi:hypothetical protein